MACSSALAAIAGPCIPVAEAMSARRRDVDGPRTWHAQGRRIVRASWPRRKPSRRWIRAVTPVVPSSDHDIPRSTSAVARSSSMPAAAPSRWPSSASRGAVLPHSGSAGPSGRVERIDRWRAGSPSGGRIVPAPPPSSAGRCGHMAAWPNSASCRRMSWPGQGRRRSSIPGLPGSEGTIHEALMAAGLDWKDVGHVILTHKHGDHAAASTRILAAASGATRYAGEADLAEHHITPALTSVRTATRSSACGSWRRRAHHRARRGAR
jgi:hypothetical protein